MIAWLKSHPWYVALAAFVALAIDILLRRSSTSLPRSDRAIADDHVAVSNEYGLIAATHEDAARAHSVEASKIDAEPPAAPNGDDIVDILTRRGL